MLKKSSAMALTVLMICTLATTAMAADTKKFSDVLSTDWFYADVNYLVKAGGINGLPDGTFKPNETMTYAEFIKTCISASTATTYTSKDGEPWYQAAYQACLDKGVITAEEVTATELTTAITREDMALILVRTAQIVNKEAVVDTAGVSAKIADASKISADRTTYVYQAYKMGMLQGSYGNFKPTTSATRAECSTVIHRLMEKSVRLSYDNLPDATQTPTTPTDSIYVARGDYAGRVKTSVATELDLAALKTAKFYKENGKYYVSITVPSNMPSDAKMLVGLKVKDANNYYIYENSNKDANGTIKFEVTPTNGGSMSNISYATLTVKVSNASGDMITHTLYTSNPGKVKYQSTISSSDCGFITFDTTGIYNW